MTKIEITGADTWRRIKDAMKLNDVENIDFDEEFENAVTTERWSLQYLEDLKYRKFEQKVIGRAPCDLLTFAEKDLAYGKSKTSDKQSAVYLLIGDYDALSDAEDELADKFYYLDHAPYEISYTNYEVLNDRILAQLADIRQFLMKHNEYVLKLGQKQAKNVKAVKRAQKNTQGEQNEQ